MEVLADQWRLTNHWLGQLSERAITRDPFRALGSGTVAVNFVTTW